MLSPQDVAQLTRNGSPVALQAVGRLFGLGDAERTALLAGNVPGWAWFGLGLVAGTVAGIYVHHRWPDPADKVIGK